MCHVNGVTAAESVRETCHLSTITRENCTAATTRTTHTKKLSTVLDYIKNGIKIIFKGNRDNSLIYGNWKSASNF